MAQYLVIHHAPGVTTEDFQRAIPLVVAGKYAKFVHCYANLVDGVIVNIYEADNPEAVAREMEHIGFPFDEIKQIQFSASADKLRGMAQTTS